MNGPDIPFPLFVWVARFSREAYSHVEQDGYHRIDTVIRSWFDDLDDRWLSRVLDVGCGTGPALDVFESYDIPVIGVTRGPDLDEARAEGHIVHDADVSFLPFGDSVFGVVFARQILEHSPAPLLTLCEWNRVLVQGGYLYVEVPRYPEGVGTRNHYSCFPEACWFDMFDRAGFVPVRHGEWFGSWAWLLRKKIMFSPVKVGGQ